MALPREVGPDENLARFLWPNRRGNRNYDLQAGVVTWHVFEPEPVLIDGREVLRTSTYRTLIEQGYDVWQIARDRTRTAARPLEARADIVARLAFDLRLQIIPDAPNHHHSPISGWPDEWEKVISTAQALAASAVLITHPGGPFVPGNP